MALALGKLTTGTPKFRGSGFVGMHVKPITAQEKFNFPRANAILARAQALLWVRDWFNTRNKSGISAHPCIILYLLHFLDQTRSSCEKCNYRPSGRNRICGPEIPVKRSNQLSYRVQLTSINTGSCICIVSDASIRYG